ncbi:PucR family transcriptional regulator [Salibacterium halotolerans]|uniref:DNA-binding transcriptional regulator, PucR family n=1 Tax=Salibacterium halotolerans TaxID=1884432 RepID=A0A1I5RGM3_9BACI|nr:helix-turn-helix domain-containing protein [Salibacterium halotolerans]SFP57431.1 DNA-binding transcriptional regulator, PucR family [Salibacterium halotolerans]
MDKHNALDRTFSSMEELADCISEMMQGPVTVEDSSHRLLAYSTHDDHTDAARVSTIIGRRVPEHVINKLWKEGILPALHQNEEPVRIPEIHDIGLGRRMAAPVRNNKEILGYLWVLEGSCSLEEQDTEFLKKAAAKAVIQLQQVQTSHIAMQQHRRDYFWRLLTGDVSEEEEIAEQLSEWFNALPSRSAVVVLESGTTLDDSLYDKMIYVMDTSRKVKGYFYTRDQNRIVCLAEPVYPYSEEGIHLFLRDFPVMMKERFQIEGMQTVAGSVYRSLSRIKQSYEEALHVLEVNRQLSGDRSSFLLYEELGFYRYADVIQKKKNRDAEGDPSLAALHEYDEANRTELFESLRAFLHVDGNMKKASEMMHVHVNTMSYRIRRVEDIIQKDLKNAYHKLSLLLEMTMEEMK